VAAVLESLCWKGASGVLEVDGNPAGAIYLDQGRITFARSSWAPDLTARLCGALRPSPELRNFLRGSDQAESNSGALLVRRGYMSENDLRSILRSAVIDALIVLTMPLAGESSVLDIRFEAPSAHWAAAFLRLPLEAVQPDVTRRAAQMTSTGVAHTAPVALRDLDRPAAVLTRTQWAIASRVDGTLSPRDLARQSGLSLYETVTSLGALLRRGLCAPTLEPDAVPRPAPSAAITSVPPAIAPTIPLPPDTLSHLITPTAPPAPRRPDPVLPAEPAASTNGTASEPGTWRAPAASTNGAGPRPTSADPEPGPGQPDRWTPPPWPSIDPAGPSPVSPGLAREHSVPSARPSSSRHPDPLTGHAPGQFPPDRSGSLPATGPGHLSADPPDPLRRPAPNQPAADRPDPLGHPAPEQSVPDYSDPLTSPAPTAHPAAAAAVPPVRSESDWAALADPLAVASRLRWPHRPGAATAASADAASSAPWTAENPAAADPATPDISVTAASTDVPAARASWTDASAPAGRAPWTTPAAPGARRPAVDPAPLDVPSTAPAAPGSPSYPSHRRSTRRPWPQSEAPVPPATLASPTPASPTPAGQSRTGQSWTGQARNGPAQDAQPQDAQARDRQPWDGHVQNGQTPAGPTPAPPAPGPDPAAQPPASVWGEPSGAHAARPARGAHRADPASRPEASRPEAARPEAARAEAARAEAPRTPAVAARGTEPPESPDGFPPDWPVLPQRQPRRRLSGGPYTPTEPRPHARTEPGSPTATDPRPEAATQPFPAVADGWPQRTPLGRPAEPSYTSDHPSAPLPVTPPAPARATRPAGSARNGEGAESADFAPAAPDLLRRVLDGLRRLT